jgi:hypothetical protein
MLFVSIIWNLLLSFSFLAVWVTLMIFLSGGFKKLKLKKPVALPLRAFSNGSILYTWEDWERDNKKEFPIRYFLTETLRIFMYRLKGKLDRAYQWVRTRTWCRYHILDVRGPGYSGGYRDCDTIMLYANFKILVDFVEIEMDGVFMEEVPPGTHEDWETTHFEHKVEKEQEIKALYEWFVVDRFRWKLAFTHEESYEVEQMMLHRLIEVRPYLWT